MQSQELQLVPEVLEARSSMGGGGMEAPAEIPSLLKVPKPQEMLERM